MVVLVQGCNKSNTTVAIAVLKSIDVSSFSVDELVGVYLYQSMYLCKLSAREIGGGGLTGY